MKLYTDVRVIVMSPEALYAQRKMREAGEWQNHREYRRWRLRAVFWSVFFAAAFLAVAAVIAK